MHVRFGVRRSVLRSVRPLNACPPELGLGLGMSTAHVPSRSGLGGSLGSLFPTNPYPAFYVPKKCQRLPHQLGFGFWVRVLGYGAGLLFLVWVMVLGYGFGSGLWFWVWVMVLSYDYGSGLWVWVWVIVLG